MSLLQIKYSVVMFGSDKATLVVQAVTDTGSMVLRTQRGAVGDSWVLFIDDLPKSDIYTVEFLATPGVNSSGVLAIDDIELGPCKGTMNF